MNWQPPLYTQLYIPTGSRSSTVWSAADRLHKQHMRLKFQPTLAQNNMSVLFGLAHGMTASLQTCMLGAPALICDFCGMVPILQPIHQFEKVFSSIWIVYSAISQQLDYTIPMATLSEAQLRTPSLMPLLRLVSFRLSWGFHNGLSQLHCKNAHHRSFAAGGCGVFCSCTPASAGSPIAPSQGGSNGEWATAKDRATLVAFGRNLMKRAG